MMRKRLLAGCVTVFLLLLAACGSDQGGRVGSSGNGGSSDERGGPSDEQVNWDEPLPLGTVTAIDPSPTEVKQTESHVSFPVVIPTDLGSPVEIIEQDPSTGVTSGPQSIAFLYQTKSYGQVDVLEGPPTISPEAFMDELHAMVDEWMADPELLHGSFKFVTLTDGTEALTTTTEDGLRTDIRWLDKDQVEITVEGPELTFDDVVAIANDIAASPAAGS